MIKIYFCFDSKTFRLFIAIALTVFSTSLFAGGEDYHRQRGKKKLPGRSKTERESRVNTWIHSQPVEFLENKGQMLDMNNSPVPSVLFKAEVPGIDVYITEKGLTYVFLKVEEVTDDEEHENMNRGQEEKVKITYEKVDMELLGATIKMENIVKADTGIAYFNYLMGPGKTISHVKKFRHLTVKNVYPGIDWVLYNANGHGFKYDFIVRPGAEAEKIQMLYRSKKEIQLDKGGNILIKSFSGDLKENAPYSYRQNDLQKVDSRFQLLSREKKKGLIETLIGFKVSAQKVTGASPTIVIDPQLVWSTFFGGSSIDGTTALDTDTLGNIYTCGYGGSTNIPLLNAGTYFQPTPSPGFIMKFNDAGVLLWSTYYAGSGTQILYIKVDKNGNAFICGPSTSTNYPVVNNNTFLQVTNAGVNDAHIAKFDNAGNCVWATLYGGNNQDNPYALSTDLAGNVFMVGTTASTNFPVQNAGTYFDAANTPNSISAFIVKFDNNGNRLWATHVEGVSIPGTCTDRFGNVYMVGISTNAPFPLLNPGGSAYYQATALAQDGCILKFSNSGVLRWGTFYGGSSQEYINSVVADNNGNTFMLGVSQSTNLPVQNAGTFFQGTWQGMSDAILLKFDSVGVRQWATFLGGSRGDFIVNSDGLALDACGNLYVGLYTRSHNIPLMSACDGGYNDAILDTSFNLNNSDIYMARFSNNGTLQWGTYFGGDGNDFRASLCVNRFGNYFITGEWISPTNAASYPIVNPGGSAYFSAPFVSDDIYISKFSIPSAGVQSFSYNSYCVNDTNHLPLKSPGFIMGGTFTSSAGLGINPQTGQVTPSTSAPGTYTVNYVLGSCHCASAQATVKGTATVTILAIPVITVTGNYTVCAGKPASFTASGASSYSWNTGGTRPVMTLTAPTATAILNYTVSGTQSNGGCTAKRSFSVVVSKCTGVDELFLNGARLQVYPNPNKGEFTVAGSSNVSLQLVNELGQLLQVVELSFKNNYLAVIKDLPKGVYFLRDMSGAVSDSHKIIVSE